MFRVTVDHLDKTDVLCHVEEASEAQVFKIPLKEFPTVVRQRMTTGVIFFSDADERYTKEHVIANPVETLNLGFCIYFELLWKSY